MERKLRRAPTNRKLKWFKATADYYEAKFNPDDVSEHAILRVMTPERAFDEDDYHFAVFHPDKSNGLQLYGHAASFMGAVRLAEAACENKGWFNGREIEFDRDGLDQGNKQKKKRSFHRGR